MTLEQIALAFGTYRQALERCLHTYGFKKNERVFHPQWMIDKVEEMVNRRYTYKEIARELNIKSDLVRYIVRKKLKDKIKQRHCKQGGRKVFIWEYNEMILLRKNGFRLDEIAEKFDISRSTVMNYLAKAGVYNKNVKKVKSKNRTDNYYQCERKYGGIE